MGWWMRCVLSHNRLLPFAPQLSFEENSLFLISFPPFTLEVPPPLGLQSTPLSTSALPVGRAGHATWSPLERPGAGQIVRPRQKNSSPLGGGSGGDHRLLAGRTASGWRDRRHAVPPGPPPGWS